MPEAAARPGWAAEAPAWALLALIAIAAWAWLLLSQTAGGAMAGMGGMSAPPTSRPSLAGGLGPAAAMAAAMMLPVVAPVVVRRRSGSLPFTIGYLAPWLAFGLALTWVTSIAAIGALAADRRLATLILAAAGLYQLSPAKRWALSACARLAGVPAAPTAAAGGALGVRYGVRCLSSGGPLMLAAGLVGAMSPARIATLALTMLAEKTRHGRIIARLSGLSLIAAATLRLLV